MDDLPFEWIPGEVVEQAYVEIGGVKYYVTPAVYAYGTSLSAYHLNRSEYEVLERAKNTFSKKAVEIFDGSTKGGTNILSDDVSKYNYFEIFYENNDHVLSSTKVFTDYSSSFRVDCNAITATSINSTYTKYTQYEFMNKSITASGSSEVRLYSNAIEYSDSNQITIKKVLAYDIGGSE